MTERQARIYDPIYEARKDYAAESATLHDLIQGRKPEGNLSLLDVGCGTGQHLAHLRQHYTVEGLDLNPDMLSIAAARLPNVPLHLADMRRFDLGRTFDVVLCLFGAISYVRSIRGLRAAVRAMARHLKSDGLLIVERWLTAEEFEIGTPHAAFVDLPDLKVARMNVSEVRGRLSILDFQYLVATPDGMESFRERHALGLFSLEEYGAAFRSAGLEASHTERGLNGRGLFVCQRLSPAITSDVNSTSR